MKKSIFILFLFVLESIIAQSKYPNVIPPDPVSAQFQKYLGYPVSHATGLAQIDIPIYTMDVSGVSIPFNLEYHASGITVGQQVGLIGLGWSMSPGFKITRTVLGKPDDLYPTNDIRDLYSYPFSTYLNNNIKEDEKFNYLYDIIPHSKHDPSFANDSFHDGQYDIFTLLLPNITATFILEWDSGELKATTIPESSIKIDIKGLDANGKFYSFEVTDDNGVLYKFGYSDNIPNQYVDIVNIDTDEHVTSWLLKEIDPPGANNSASFNYNSSFYVESSGSYNNYSLDFTDYYTGPEQDINLVYPDCDLGFPYRNSYDYHYPYNYQVKTVSSINFDSGESVEFKYSTVRTVFEELDGLVFKDQNGATVKTIDFEKNNKQLKNVTIDNKETYEFYYDEQIFSGVNVGMDYVGLHNGNNGGSSSIIPKMVLSYADFQNGAGLTYHPYEIGDLDITTNPKASQAGILKNIIYPTGGQTTFKYEPHSYETEDGTFSGLGLRIQQIDTYDPKSNKTISKLYKYGPGESGIGNVSLSFLKRKQAFKDEYITKMLYLSKYSGTYRTRTINSRPKNYPTQQPLIWYDEVTEYSNEGKTIFKYSFIPSGYSPFDKNVKSFLEGTDEYLGSNSTYEMTPEYYPIHFRNLGNSSPRLISKTIKDKIGNDVQHTVYGYSDDKRELMGVMTTQHATSGGCISSVRWLKDPVHTASLGTDVFQRIGATNDYLQGYNYWLEINNDKLISTTQTDYGSGGAIVSRSTLSYDHVFKFNLEAKTVTKSDGGTFTEKFYYPVGDAIPDKSSLTANQQNIVNTFSLDKNYQGRVIEKETYYNSKLLNKELFGYKDWGNNLYNIEKVYVKKGEFNFRPIYTINDYDDKGNILEFFKENDMHTSYVWGYNKQYLLAKIENFEYSQITTNIQTKINTVINASNDDDDRTTNEDVLRSGLTLLKNALPSTTMFTSYTYDPLIGITSITDPRDNIIYYDYNTEYKLKSIKDRDKNIIKDYNYNYTPTGTHSPLEVVDDSSFSNPGGGQTLFLYENNQSSQVNQKYSIYPKDIVFQDVQVGSSSEAYFYIVNTTPEQYTSHGLEVDLDLPDGFTIKRGLSPYNIPRGAPREFTIVFTPNQVSTFSGLVTPTSSAERSTDISAINLSGNGISPVSMDNNKIIKITHNGIPINNLDFGTVHQNDSIEKTFTVHNIGNSDLSITSIESSNYFPFSTNGLATVITPGSSVEFTIDFNVSGLDVGNYSSSITIRSDKNSGINTFSASGTITD